MNRLLGALLREEGAFCVKMIKMGLLSRYDNNNGGDEKEYYASATLGGTTAIFA